MKIKRGMSLALGLGVLVAGAGGALFGVPAHAASCVAAEALATEGIITSEAELQYAIANEVASVKLGNDFTITCNPSYFTDNFTLDLNGHTLTSEVSWALDIETSGKTLTIQDTVGGGKYTFNDAGIWAQDGANVTLTSGVVEATAGRGRAVQVTSGKLTIAGGEINAVNGSYVGSDSKTYYYNTALVYGSGASVEMSGGKVTSDNGTALYAYGEGVTMTFSGGEISSTGDYALMVSNLATLTMSNGKVEANDFPLTVFNGSTANISGGEVHAKTGFAVSANFNQSPAYMNISGGTLTSDGDFAILFPGDPASVSRLSITGTPTITGAGGVIAMNSGILEITGGTLTSLGTEGHTGTIGNGSNGFTTSVLGLAAGYADVTATISGGTFINQGESELVWTTDVCKELGTSGTCDMDLTITGGYFSEKPERKYVDENYTVYETGAVEMAPYEVMEPIVPTAGQGMIIAKGETVDASGMYDDETKEYGDFDLSGLDGIVSVNQTEATLTGLAKGIGTISYVIKDAYDTASSEPIEDKITVYDVEAGEDTETVSEDDDDTVNEAVLGAVKDFLANGTAEEDYVTEEAVLWGLSGLRNDIASGKQVLSELAISEFDDEDMLPIIEEELRENVEFLDGEKFATAYAANIYVLTGDDDNQSGHGYIQKLDKAIALTFMIPEEFREVPAGYLRTFYVTRLHYDASTEETSYTRLAATTSADGTSITTESDLFSTFAITYVDVAIPNTGYFTSENDYVATNSKVGIWMLCVGMLMVGYGMVSLGRNEYRHMIRERNIKG